MAKIKYFECSCCGDQLSTHMAGYVCPKDGGFLYACYDLAAIRESVQRPSPADATNTMWRYAAVLPDAQPVTLGEGMTPLLPSSRYPNLFIKEEGLNPTGSLEARAMSAAVTMARHDGIEEVSAFADGNSGGALAAYAAAADLKAHVFVPPDTPLANRLEVAAFGARLSVLGQDGSPSPEVAEYLDISAWQGPFQIEGRKTVAYELAEKLGWRLPDAILLPGSAATGVIAMWKAFAEMEELGWVPPGKRPKMICCQTSSNAPILKALLEDSRGAVIGPGTRPADSPPAHGHAHVLALDFLRRSGGAAVAVSDDAMKAGIKQVAANEGILAAPEGGAVMAAYLDLLREGFLDDSHQVVLINPASGYKYLDALQECWRVTSPADLKLPASRNIGGIIGPY
jgi:threonine synthase